MSPNFNAGLLQNHKLYVAINTAVCNLLRGRDAVVDLLCTSSFAHVLNSQNSHPVCHSSNIYVTYNILLCTVNDSSHQN